MKSFSAAIFAAGVVRAHMHGGPQMHPRQATAAPVAGAAAASAPASFTLLSTDASAVPLASIVSGSPNQPTPTFASPAAGATPTYMTAPGLPDISNWLNMEKNYPPPDKIPPTDSPEVQQWKKDVAASGVFIPDLAVNKYAAGESLCDLNPDAMKNGTDKDSCWWSCTGCVRSSDVSSCPEKNTWGLTYDDGPAEYTPQLLNYLAEKKLQATFFTIGSRILYQPAMLQAEYLAGHQIGVHTWSHFQPLTTMTTDQIIAELGWTKKITKDILGVTPNTWRPPFGDIDDRVRAISIAMGLTPIIWTRISPVATFDTDDFNVANGLATVDTVLSNWGHILGNASTINTGFIVLEHDLFPQSVDIATGYILPDALAHTNPSFKIMPVAQCLGLSQADAYIETNDNKTNTPIQSGSHAAVSVTNAPGASGSGAAASGSGSHSNNGAQASGTGNAASRVALLSGGAIVAAGSAVVGALIGASLVL